jgi:hypothetical protein
VAVFLQPVVELFEQAVPLFQRGVLLPSGVDVLLDVGEVLLDEVVVLFEPGVALLEGGSPLEQVVKELRRRAVLLTPSAAARYRVAPTPCPIFLNFSSGAAKRGVLTIASRHGEVNMQRLSPVTADFF